MLYVLTNSTKPVSELGARHVFFRKVDRDRGAIIVSRSADGILKLIDATPYWNGSDLRARGLTKDEMQVLQMNASAGTIKFVFEIMDEKTLVRSYHSSIHTIEADA